MTTAPNDWDALPIILDSAETAALLRCDVKEIRKYAKRPDFPAVMDGKKIRVSRDNLRVWINKQAGGTASLTV